MLRGLATPLKQAMFFYLTNTSCSAKKVNELLFSFWSKCADISLNVEAVVIDKGYKFGQLVTAEHYTK